MDTKNGMRPVHPGEILREELDVLGLSANALARALGVPVNRITQILHGQRGVTADTALRLARYFGTTPQLGQARANRAGKRNPPAELSRTQAQLQGVNRLCRLLGFRAKRRNRVQDGPQRLARGAEQSEGICHSFQVEISRPAGD